MSTTTNRLVHRTSSFHSRSSDDEDDIYQQSSNNNNGSYKSSGSDGGGSAGRSSSNVGGGGAVAASLNPYGSYRLNNGTGTRKKKRRSGDYYNVDKKQQQATTYSIVMFFLLAGLFFCVLDWLYIVHYMSTRIMETDTSSSDTLSNPASSSAAAAARMNADPALFEAGGDDNDNDDRQRRMKAILDDPDRSKIVKLLQDAKLNLTALPIDKIEQIPKWSDVTAMYGERPVIIGLDTCKTFQNLLDPEEHFVSTAGTFNTGTNLMAELLIANCHMPARMAKYGNRQRGVRWQVLWGKHTPVFNESYRLNHRTYNDSTLSPENIFPAVMVRDPYKWMQSMCRHEYAADWPHPIKSHCPNLVYTNETYMGDHKTPATPTKTNGVPVAIHYSPKLHTYHDTLVGFWNDWYGQYANAKWPRLLVRFEDLIFFPRMVTEIVCECAGGQLNRRGPFTYITESAKKGSAAHGKASERTTYLDALIKYGTEKGRYNGYDAADVQYANEHLDPHLMNLFKYKFPTETSKS